MERPGPAGVGELVCEAQEARVEGGESQVLKGLGSHVKKLSFCPEIDGESLNDIF